MSSFSQLPEFEKELRKLSRKYPSLVDDVEDVRQILESNPTGIGKNFTIIASLENVKIVKIRLQCESLRARTVRMIYAYHNEEITFMYLEIYFKGDKENEDRERIKKYLQTL